VPIKKHSNKEIRAALDYALKQGWVIVKAGKSAHAFCKIRCGNPGHETHTLSVWSTPKNPTNHARAIIKKVDECN